MTLAKPTLGSLFAGIGGIDLGLERAGFQTIWQVENNDYCNKVLQKHWPDVKRYGDITKVDWSGVEIPDIMAGGFPCQDLSVAGKGAGINGERSGLWKEFHKAICALRPRLVLVENVPGLLSWFDVEPRLAAPENPNDGDVWEVECEQYQGIAKIDGDFSEAGYNARWFGLSAADVGARHGRGRVFIVGNPKHDGLYGYKDGRGCDKTGNRCEKRQGPARESEGTGGSKNSRNIQRMQMADTESPKCKHASHSWAGGIGVARGRSVVPNTDGRRFEEFKEFNSSTCEDSTNRNPQRGHSNGLCNEISYSNGSRAQMPITRQQSTVKLIKRIIEKRGFSEWKHDPAEKSITVKPGMGDLVDGVPSELDEHFGYTPRVATGIKNRVERLKCLGNAVVPQVAEVIGIYIKENYIRGNNHGTLTT